MKHYVITLAALAAAMNLTVGNFSGGDLNGWTAQSFQGTTSYRLVAQDGRRGGAGPRIPGGDPGRAGLSRIQGAPWIPGDTCRRNEPV